MFFSCKPEKMLLQLIAIVVGCVLQLPALTSQADSCNTYNHPQYGIGQCIDQTKCPNALYISGLCESQPASIKCCFSLAKPQEEFRAAWIATVTNIDWPSSRTATPAQQQTELLNILNTIQTLNMNAVVFQVEWKTLPVADFARHGFCSSTGSSDRRRILCFDAGAVESVSDRHSWQSTLATVGSTNLHC